MNKLYKTVQRGANAAKVAAVGLALSAPFAFAQTSGGSGGVDGAAIGETIKTTGEGLVGPIALAVLGLAALAVAISFGRKLMGK